MTLPVSLLLLAAIGVGTSCGVNKLSDRQQRALEATCGCECVRLDVTPETLEAWASEPPGVLTMAWGGGMWRCQAGRPR
ncbi:MAG: hypothetical protein NUW22_12380 [Acidobacteria bacterium]|nr:hypothetical protein [Acidobacteriota bacterium]